MAGAEGRPAKPQFRYRFGGLARRLFLAFLAAAVIPTGIAGITGVYVSVDTLRQETLRNLSQEVGVRASSLGRFFDQLSSELRYLASSAALADLLDAARAGDTDGQAAAARRLEQEYTAFATHYPHIYQLRFLDAEGLERARVDRIADQVLAVPAARLQDKSDRYYFQEAIRWAPGGLYVSPLDLNIEFGVVEKPERPVIRLATPVIQAGSAVGVIIVNLHADVLLEQVQQMADARGGTAFLIDRQGHYLTRSPGSGPPAFAMYPLDGLERRFSAVALENILADEHGTDSVGGEIVAHAAISHTQASERSRWIIALALPEQALFMSVLNLYLLYAVLAVALVVTAVGGYLVSRRLLEPLADLAGETEALAAGDFSRRITVRGDDEIATVSDKFNSMAERLQQLYRELAGHRDRLEREVADRTRELEGERTFLATVIDHTGDGILSVDAGGRIRLANRAAEDLLPEPSVAEGKALAGYWPTWPEIAAQAREGAEWRGDLVRDGQVLALSVTPAGDDLTVVARDVSDERRLAEERRELDRQMFQVEKMTTLGEIAMGVAHEIGNPLAGMKAVAQALQYEEDLPVGVIEALRRLEGETDRLAAFLRTFNGFAAVQGIAPVACELAALLEDALLWTRKEARTRGVAIAVEGVVELPPLRADPNQLKQVLLNLIVNAIHAMPGGGTLTIAAESAAGFARIRFEDTGVGIAPDVLPHIFEPFYTTRPDGSGLGLAIVRKIVMANGARIVVDSHPGAGARFVLEWPLAESGVATAHA
jgi:signal transduction histidine kinase